RHPVQLGPAPRRGSAPARTHLRVRRPGRAGAPPGALRLAPSTSGYGGRMPGSDAEDICEAIARRRGCGAVHCGITGGAASVTEVARAFGLRADPLCYHEIDEVSARAVAAGVLGRDL